MSESDIKRTTAKAIKTTKHIPKQYHLEMILLREHSQVSQVNQVSQTDQVNQVSQTNQVNQVSQVSQVLNKIKAFRATVCIFYEYMLWLVNKNFVGLRKYG